MTLFKSGDLVVLKSGGPTMTIDTVNTDIFDDDKITGLLCVWFDGDFMHRVRFDHRAVRPALQPKKEEAPVNAAPRKKTRNDVATRSAAPTPVIAAESEHQQPVAANEGHVADDAAEPEAHRNETPASPATPEAAGEYAAVLDNMMGAMNNAAGDPVPTGPTRPARRARATPRTRPHGKTTTTH